ncbi:MAG: EamA family transporter [Fidelibacterota bacterium]|nr:MAG: EamA family transporter [Candidatus Neomarinimicrobiota bacterium]
MTPPTAGMNPRPRVGLVFTCMCLIWGSTFVALKTGLEETPPLLGVALRNLLASLILFLIIYWRKLPIPFDRLARKQYLTVGLLDFFLSYSLTYSGTQFIYSNISALLWASIPITTALVAHFALPSEPLTFRKGLGILVGFGGVVLIFVGYGFGKSQNLLLGMILVMGAVLAATWPSVYLKRRAARANPIVLTAIATGIGGLTTLLGSFTVESPSQMIWSPLNIGIILFLAVFGTVFAWVAYFYLLEHMEVVKLSFVGFIAPVIATFMGMIVLNELLSSTVFLGAFLVLFGIFLTDARRYARMLVRR